jgi:glycosyltransferase involved in cell wall biosynthesis
MSDVYEFIFIGRKFNSNYDSSLINVVGPFSGMELADKLRNCDIYITASKYDSCPMHVLEGLSCGLPMLYSNNTGGVKNICEITSDKVGEKFVDFDDLINKLEIIKNNYDIYYDNILRNINFYNSNDCYTKYLKLMYCLV